MLQLILAFLRSMNLLLIVWMLEKLDVKITFWNEKLDKEIYKTQHKGFIEKDKKNTVC